MAVMDNLFAASPLGSMSVRDGVYIAKVEMLCM